MSAPFSMELSHQAAIAIGLVVVTYIAVITLFGGYFARFNSNINDFFYSGQRLSWWLPAASMMATGIGSYSYLKYSEQGFLTGMSSAQTYMNDWFIVPFFMFGWLPIVYFARVKSIPEYFERRFNSTARYISLSIILSYMFFYIGYNLFTIGIAFKGMFGISPLISVPIVTFFLGAYVTFGGQIAVVFTDLFQGVMLYLAGGIAVLSGIWALGGFSEFWAYLPVESRLPFTELNDDPKFNTAGIFWGEALAGSIAFTFMNQGFIMRYLSIKSIGDCRKAVVFNILVTMPISAVIVGAVGWVGQSLIAKQTVMGGPLTGYDFLDIQNTFHTFIVVCWTTLKQNHWLFGFVIAALMAALMSTIDTLINACAAIGIYDIYKPLIRPDAEEAHYLRAARYSSVLATLLGLALVPLFFLQKGSLFSLHYQGVMIIIPSIVTTIFMGAFWRSFNATAACSAMIAGSLFTFLTIFFPHWIDPLSEFVLGPKNGEYIYMRAPFGMVVTALIGTAVAYLTKPPPTEKIAGLTIQTLDHSMQSYKGGEPNHTPGRKVRNLSFALDSTLPDSSIALPADVMDALQAKDGDIIYLSDNRWWLGGLRSAHVIAMQGSQVDGVHISPSLQSLAHISNDSLISVEKII